MLACGPPSTRWATGYPVGHWAEPGSIVDDRLNVPAEFFIGGPGRGRRGGAGSTYVSPSTEDIVGGLPGRHDGRHRPGRGRERGPRRPRTRGPGWRRATGADVLAAGRHHLAQARGRDRRASPSTRSAAPSSQAPRAQTGMVAALFDYYAELIRTYPFERQVRRRRSGRPGDERARRVVAAITPWNARSRWPPGNGAGAGGRVHRGDQAPARRPR